MFLDLISGPAAAVLSLCISETNNKRHFVVAGGKVETSRAHTVREKHPSGD